MITVHVEGSFKNTEEFLKYIESERMFDIMDRYGRIGVDALARETPRETGETAASWSYRVSHKAGLHEINWYNSHKENGVNIAVILQYGHGTGTGGWVEGRDYINPAVRDIFDKMADDVWKQVKNG